MVYAIFGAFGAAAALAPSASAGWLVADAGECASPRLSQPFRQWLDPMEYTPVQDGGIERKAEGWKLEGEARAALGNEPWSVGGEGDSRSLVIPQGSSATTPAACVGLQEPTLRLFARGSAAALPYMDVEVLFEDAAGRAHSKWIGYDLGGSWHPTSVMPIGVNLLPLLPGSKTPVAFRFTAEVGDFQIDDVYVDPWFQR